MVSAEHIVRTADLAAAEERNATLSHRLAEVEVDAGHAREALLRARRELRSAEAGGYLAAHAVGRVFECLASVEQSLDAIQRGAPW